MAKLTNDSNNQTYIYHQLTIYNSHDSFRSGRETSVIVNNNSSFQNYTNPDDHTQQTTDTPGFKPFTVLKYFIENLKIITVIIQFCYVCYYQTEKPDNNRNYRYHLHVPNYGEIE